MELPVGQMGQSTYILEYEELDDQGKLISQRILNTHETLNNISSTSHKSIMTSLNPRTYSVLPHQNILPDPNKNRRKNRRENKVFGDHLVEKENNCIRIVSQNVNCLGISNTITHKQDNAKDWLIQHEVDVVGWQEIGVAFHMLPRKNRLANRLKDIRWKKIRISSSNNKHESIDAFQYGGTAVISFDEAAHRVKATGADETGLGRWSWMVFEGKHKHVTRIISAYIPCKSSPDRYQTVYNQHRRYFLKQGNTECPRKIMHRQLTEQIKKWQSKGENIVLLIDTNENLARMGQLQTKLKYECQLVDPIRNIYQNDGDTLPSTSLTGSYPIDAIFVSPQLQQIVRGGWIQVEKSIGDHRALFIDIPIKTLLGENPFTIHRSTARRLICEQPKIVEKYNQLLENQLIQQKTFQKFNNFSVKYRHGITQSEDAIKELDSIDNSITNCIIYAEKRCRKLKSGMVPYTPEISAIGKEINVWNNVLRKKRGCNISSTYIKRIAKKSGIINPSELSLEDCYKERDLATKKYKRLKRNARQSRTQFIQELASQQAARGNESVSNAILRINRIEEIRDSYKRIKTVTKPFFGATEKVLISNHDCSEERITTDKIEIEQALCSQNRIKFTSAYSSPFLQEPLLSQIGQTATSINAQKILDGTYQPPSNISNATKEFIQHLQTPHSIKLHKSNDPICSIETATAYWRKKRERTNSSMSGRHIGTYRALTYGNTRTLQMINCISNYAFNIGAPLTRWTKDLDVSLLKKPNKIRPSELRTIGTLEADFNQGASLHFSKRMMSNGITHRAIPPSQYAKKGNRSIEAAIVKILFFDYLRINKINGVFMAMDLENCFDRMAHPVSSLASQRLGVSSSIAKCMITTLCNMQHYIRTAYGDSDWSYGGKHEKKILQGAVQGNGAASPIFIAISCVIIAFLESKTIGVQIVSAITLTVFTMSAIMYVDDSDILLSAISHDDTAEMLRDRAQSSASAYQQGVQQTGGAIRPDKCRWYSITFKWIGSKWKYENKPKLEPIFIENAQGKMCPIQQLDNKVGWKGLGVVAAPNGNWKDHIEYLVKEKISPWNASIQNSYLQKHDVYRAAFTSIFKTVDYTLPATSMTQNECKLINIQLHKKYLSRIGIDMHLPLAYRYSPPKYQGLGSLDVESKQFIEKLKIFLTHAGTETQLGISIKIMMESMNLMVGVNKSIFETSYAKYGFLAEIGWMQNLWQMSQKYNIQIHGEYTKSHLNRKNDFALMEKVVESDLYNQDDIISINKCRIYLQVQNLSDIVNGQGTKISYYAKNHIRDIDRPTCYKWPNQNKPTKLDWEAWDDAILHVWSKSERLEINPPLSHWINTSFNTAWYHDQGSNNLYYKTSGSNYNVYKPNKTSRRNNVTSYIYYDMTSTAPASLKPAIVDRSNPFQPILESTIELPTTPEDMSDRQHHKKIFMDQITFPNDVQPLIQQIKNGNAIAVTDASLSPITGIGASSFTITTTDLKTSCCGSHGVPKGISQLDSYRTELYGIFGIMVCLQHLVEEHEISHGNILIACDNKASINNAFQYNSRSNIKNGSFDIIWAIQKIHRCIPINIQYQHVRGHQDRTKTTLSLLETLNCIMDKRAGQYRTYIESASQYEYSHIHWNYNWHCSINGKYITDKLEYHVKDNIFRQQMKSFLITKKGYTSESFENIDWHAIGMASKTITVRKQIWATKYASGFYAHASRMQQRGLWNENTCPICKHEIENSRHMIKCNDEKTKVQYAKSIQKFFDYIHKVHTHPSICTIFEQALKDSTPTSFAILTENMESDNMIKMAAIEQDEIGWDNFFKGHISKKWAIAQLKHYENMYKNPPSIAHWAKNIIIQIYNVTFEIWMHRNKVVHDNFEGNLSQQESIKLQEQITEEFRKGTNGLLIQHKYLLERPVEEIYKKNVNDKKYWLKMIQASRICYEKCALHHNTTRTIDLTYATVPD